MPGNKEYHVYCENSLELINHLKDIDILYLDPPYTKKQYAASYHLIETIARWDQPTLFGKTGLRNYQSLKSSFCYQRHALNSLKHIVHHGRYRHLLLSYSNDSIVPHENILNLLEQYGNVHYATQLLPRYNSLSKNSSRYQSHAYVKERLYYLEPHAYSPSQPLSCVRSELAWDKALGVVVP